MTVADKKDETVQERKLRSDADPDLRAELAKSAHHSDEKVGLDGLSKHVVHFNKDGEVIAEDTVGTSLAEATEAFKREIALAVVGVVPAALSAEVEVKAAGGKDDEATVTLKLSRNQESSRLPHAKQGTQSQPGASQK